MEQRHERCGTLSGVISFFDASWGGEYGAEMQAAMVDR